MADFYRVIHSEMQIREFYQECLPRLKPTEVYFLSMAARNKYLTAEERVRLDVGRTEMYGKTLVRHDTADDFVKHVRRFECDKRGYTSRTGEPLPEKSMVCYVNLDPSSGVDAAAEFQKLLQEFQQGALKCAVRGMPIDRDGALFARLDDKLLSCYQKAHAKGPWIDIDIDLENKDDKRTEAIQYLVESFFIQYSIFSVRMISTKSGYHVLVPTRNLKCNPAVLAKGLEESLVAAGDRCKEVVVNTNRMVPLPGTYQSDYPVTLLPNLRDKLLDQVLDFVCIGEPQ